MVVFAPGEDFPFDKMKTATPAPLQGGGAYYSELSIGGEAVCVQLPQCSTKAGVTTTKRGGYVDLLYASREHSDLMRWLERIEATVTSLVVSQKDIWFTNDVNEDDINCMTAPIVRSYHSGKSILVRLSLFKNRHNPLFYNEQQVALPDTQVIAKDCSVIPLIIVSGIKYTTRSISIDLVAKQIMVLDKEDPNVCMISRPAYTVSSISPDNEEVSEESDSLPAVEEIPLPPPAPAQDVCTERTKDCAGGIEEWDIQTEAGPPISLKSPEEVYMAIYATAYENAVQMKTAYLKAFAKAEELRELYKLDPIDTDSLALKDGTS